MGSMRFIGIFLTILGGMAQATPQEDSGCLRYERDRQSFSSAPKSDTELLKLLSIQINDLEKLKGIKPGFDFPKSMYDRCTNGKYKFIYDIAGAIRGKTTFEYNREMVRFSRVIEDIKMEITYLEKSFEVKPDKEIILEWWQSWLKFLKVQKKYSSNAAVSDTKKVMGAFLSNKEISPKLKAYALQERAEWLRKNDSIELAINDYNAALGFDPSSFLSLVSVGSYYVDRSQFQEAIRIFKRIEQQQPNNVEVQQEIIKCEAALGLWGDFVARVDKLSNFQQLSSSLQLRYVEALLKLNRVDKADMILADLKQKKPEVLKMKEFQSIEGLKAYLRAEAFEKRGLVANAFAEYAQAVQLQPMNPDFRYRAALYIYKIHEERKFEKTPAFRKDMKKAMEFLQLPTGVPETEAIRNLKAKLGAFGL